jgi:hypothetical protein
MLHMYMGQHRDVQQLHGHRGLSVAAHLEAHLSALAAVALHRLLGLHHVDDGAVQGLHCVAAGAHRVPAAGSDSMLQHRTLVGEEEIL